MKITNKIMMLLMAALLSVSFAACSDDDKPTPTEGEETPDFILEQEFINVKIGAGNKATVNIGVGGGEYNAFCLDESLAKVEKVNDAIIVEGLANGQTSLIISDKYSRYRRLPITVYTTDVMKLSDATMEIPLGNFGKSSLEIETGNGGYKVESDNPEITASVSETDQIIIGATSGKTDQTATITITDRIGLKGSFTVTVKGILKAYTNVRLEEIKADAKRTYNYDGSVLPSSYESFFSFYNEVLEDGRQRYGWGYYSYYAYHIDFSGGKSVGVKDDASFTYKWGATSIEEPVTMEIIKNDGTNVWGTFFYFDEDEERVVSGYFCDTI